MIYVYYDQEDRVVCEKGILDVFNVVMEENDEGFVMLRMILNIDIVTKFHYL